MKTLIKKLLVLTALSLPLIPAQNAAYAQCGNHIDNSIYENLPFDMPQVEQPTFPEYSVNIVDFGAKMMELPSTPKLSTMPSRP